VVWVYILRCGDNSFYIGHTTDLESRLEWHHAGCGANHTALRLPIDLVYSEECSNMDAAIARERQLKRWSAQKKAALIAGDFAKLKQLSKRRSRKSG
jgi:predicted GIY-YIG superfamily endonuclease